MNQSDAGPPRLLSGAAWTLMALIVTGLIRAVTRIAAEASVGVDGLAAVTLAISAAAIVTIFGAGGMTPAITKLTSELRGSGDAVRARGLVALAGRWGVAASVAGGVVAAVYASLEPALSESALSPLMVGALAAVFGIYLTGKAIAYGEERVGSYVRLEIVGAALFAISLTLVLLMDASQLVLVPLIAAYLPVALLSLRRSDRASGLPLRDFRRYTMIGIVGTLAGVGFTQFTPVAASFVDVAQGAALVGAALTVLEPLNLAPRALSLVLLPRLSFSNAAGLHASAGSLLRMSTASVALISAPVCAILVLERDRVLQVIFSDSVIGGMNLAWFAAAFFVRVVGIPSITALAAVNVRMAMVSMWSSLAGFAAAGAVWVGAGQSLSIAAIGLGYFVGTMIQVAVPILVATRHYRIEWSSFWIRVALLVLATIALAINDPNFVLDGLALVVIGGIMWPEARMVYSAMTGRNIQSNPASS